jgi:pimeloyl-ACP methyl ester carboxylesterase
MFAWGFMRRLMIGMAAAVLTGWIGASTAEPQATVVADPPQDKVHPANAIPFALPTHGVRINAMLFTTAGSGAHPTVILLHGVPGNDPNFDLARAIQRAGWNVLTFHYRGSWGSPGDYSFTHCREDGEAALDWARLSSTSAAYGIDTHRIVVVGHSMGGFVAGWLAGHDDGLAGAVLISAGRSFGNLPSGISRMEVVKRMEDNLGNDKGMHTVGNTTAEELADEVIRNNAAWNLAQFAPTLAKHPLLVITSNDGGAPDNERVAAAVNAQPGAKVTVVHLATDHSYNDQRVSLASTVVRWLDQFTQVQ